jgi:hypothetical protein
MLYEIGNPTAKEVAKVLGVSEKAVKRWIKTDAPRTVSLAIFWLTRWGQQWAYAEVFNLAKLHMQLTDAETRKNKDLQAEIDRLSRLADFGSANDPSPNIRFSKVEAEPVKFARTQASLPAARREKPSVPHVPKHVLPRQFRRQRRA